MIILDVVRFILLISMVIGPMVVAIITWPGWGKCQTEEEFRRIFAELTNRGYKTVKLDPEEKEIEFPLTDAQGVIKWRPDTKFLHISVSPQRKMDKTIQAQLEKKAKIIVRKVCRKIKLEKPKHYLILIGSICGIISLLVILIQLVFRSLL